jgi:hypothetical protein
MCYVAQMESDFINEHNFGPKNFVVFTSRSWKNITAMHIKVLFYILLVDGLIIW